MKYLCEMVARVGAVPQVPQLNNHLTPSNRHFSPIVTCFEQWVIVVLSQGLIFGSPPTTAGKKLKLRSLAMHVGQEAEQYFNICPQSSNDLAELCRVQSLEFIIYHSNAYTISTSRNQNFVNGVNFHWIEKPPAPLFQSSHPLPLL